jgi:uncharacterized protein (TIRG00374 family)
MNKIKKWVLLSLLTSLISGIIVVFLTFDSETVDALLHIKLEYLLLGVLLHAFSYLVWGMRIRVLCHSLGYNVRILKAVELVTSSVLVASITPSSMGGEPIRIHLLNRENVPLGKASAVIIGERLFDGILLLSLAPFSIYLLRNTLAEYGFESILIFIEFVLLALLLFLLYAIWNPGPIKSMSYYLIKKVAPFLSDSIDTKVEHIFAKVDHELDNFHGGIVLLLKGKRSSLIYFILLTLLFWIVEFSLLYVILLGLNIHVDVLTMFASQVVMIFILLIPATPGSSGLAEFGATTIFSIFVPVSVLGITVIAWRVLTFYMNLVVGSFVSFNILKDTEFIKNLLK